MLMSHVTSTLGHHTQQHQPLLLRQTLELHQEQGGKMGQSLKFVTMELHQYFNVTCQVKGTGWTLRQ